MNPEQRGIFFNNDPTQKIIGPTPEDIQRAHDKSLTLGGQSGKVSKLVALGFGSGAVLVGTGSFFAVNAAQGEKVIKIDSFPNSFNPDDGPRLAETKKVNPDEVFDNTAKKGVISSKNILYVPPEVFDKTPLVDEQGNPILDFPWDTNKPPVKIKYEKSLYPRPDWWERAGADLDPNTAIKNTFEAKITLPAGIEFTTPYPGYVFFSGSNYNEEASQKSPSNPYGLAVYDGPIDMAKIEFIAPNGILYFINIGFNGESRIYLEPLIDAPLLGLKNRSGKDWKEGTLVERGRKIFSVPQEGTFIITMHIEGSRNGIDGPQSNIVPGNLQFQTQKDSAGVEKLLVSEAKK